MFQKQSVSCQLKVHERCQQKTRKITIATTLGLCAQSVCMHIVGMHICGRAMQKFAVIRHQIAIIHHHHHHHLLYKTDGDMMPHWCGWRVNRVSAWRKSVTISVHVRHLTFITISKINLSYVCNTLMKKIVVICSAWASKGWITLTQPLSSRKRWLLSERSPCLGIPHTQMIQWIIWILA